MCRKAEPETIIEEAVVVAPKHCKSSSVSVNDARFVGMPWPFVCPAQMKMVMSIGNSVSSSIAVLEHAHCVGNVVSTYVMMYQVRGLNYPTLSNTTTISPMCMTPNIS